MDNYFYKFKNFTLFRIKVTFRTCYRNHEAAVEYTWVNMQPVMNNWRRLNRPLLPRKPQSLQDYAMLLSMPQYSHLTHYSQGQLSVSTESSADNSLVTVLYDLNFVMSVTTSTLFMDATFKITPKQPKVYQVFTILAQINNKVHYYLINLVN